MLKKVFLLAVLFVLVLSCGSEERIPEDVLSQEKMIDLLIDIRIAEGKIGTLTIPIDSAQLLFDALEQRIFEEHQIDTMVYLKSHNYYLMNPDKYLYITDAVIDSLKVRVQQSYQSNYQR